jgi:hypothetical protein
VTQPIDVAYVELEARGEEDAVRDIERAVKDIQVAVDTASKNIQIEMKNVADEIGDSIADGVKDTEKSFDDLSDSATSDLDKIGREAKKAGKAIADGLGGDGGGAAGAGLFSQLAQIGGQLRNISALAPPPILLALTAAIPAVLALGGAVADLSALMLLLPAGIGAAAGSMIALQLAFEGVGAAVAALATGDMKKINEAMKELAPSARAVAREIFALKKPFDELKLSVQEAFFAPLRNDIENLGKVALPVLQLGLARIAGAFGRFGSQLADMLGEVDILNDVRDVFAGTARIIDGLAPSVTNLLGTLFGVAEHGVPFLERAFDALGRGIDSLAKFLGDTMANGDFDQFLEDAFQIMSDLGDLTQSVFGLLSSLFGDMGDEGSSFVQTLTSMIDKMTEFFNSAEGQAVLQRLVDTLPLLVSSLELGLTALAALAVLTEQTLRSFQKVGEWAVIAGKAIGEFFGNFDNWGKSAAGAVGDFFGMVGDFFSSVGGWFADIGRAVGSAFTTLVNFITAFAGWITDLENIGYVIGFMVGTAVKWFFILQNAVSTTFINIGKFIVGTWATIQKFTYDTVLSIVNSVINFFTSLPEKISAAVTYLRDLVVNTFKRTREGAVNQASSLTTGVTNFFKSMRDRVIKFVNDLPGNISRIFASIASRAYNMGRNILTGIINGIKAGYSAALDTAKRIARGILDGMKDALGISSPSKIAAIEVGKPIMQGVGVGVSDASADLRSVINGAISGVLPGVTGGTTSSGGGTDGGNITFDAGAVQVSFQGAVPTEQEAFRTGQAVGAGISQTLARRNVRTAVRIA